MRHKVYGKHLGRDKNQRAALFKSLVQALILNGSIQTTEAKAKAIKPTVDKIISQAKSKNTQRLLQQFLVAKPVRERLLKDVAPALKDRNSGYTSVVKLGPRLGDGAMMVRMSLLVSEEGKVKREKSDKNEKTKEKGTNASVISNISERSQDLIPRDSSQARNDKNKKISTRRGTKK